MTDNEERDILDALVIGGGFYGTAIATYLVEVHGFSKVALVEQENNVLKRASFNNQARVHNGYHYPRSYTTAYRSRINLPKFVNKWDFSVKRDFTKLYAIAKRNSKVTSKQFERFCHEIGAPIKSAGKSEAALLNLQLIDKVFEVEEFAFDAVKMRKFATEELSRLKVKLLLETKVKGISKGYNNYYTCATESAGKSVQELHAKRVFNCTYSGVQTIKGEFKGVSSPIKHEITEMALITPPESFKNIGITVMDGPFFSAMPFPSEGLHTLSHVRYTPHTSWNEDGIINPYEKLTAFQFLSRFERMKRDVARYIPDFLMAKYIDSLLEVKTILLKNESDDGRPILFEKSASLPGVYTILGGKIDNIFDIFEKLDEELGSYTNA